MKATLFVIENDADHAQAKALVEKLMGSRDPCFPRALSTGTHDGGPFLEGAQANRVAKEGSDRHLGGRLPAHA
jgi:hypothetical protein